MDTLNDDPSQNLLVTGASVVENSCRLDEKWCISNPLGSETFVETGPCFVAGHCNSGENSIFTAFTLQWVKGACAVFILLFSFWTSTPVMAAQLRLQWDASTDPNLADYRVYVRSAGGTVYTEPVWTGESTSCTVDDLLEDGSYCFVVRVANIDGLESDDSNEACYSFPADSASTEDSAEVDTDGDGMPDDWETEMGLDPNGDDSEDDQDDDSISNLDEYENGSDPNVAADNTPPQSPSGNWPTEGAAVDTMAPELVTDGFSDTDSESSHYKTRWRIMRMFDNVCVFDGTSKFFLTSFTVPNWVLEPETEYSWQVQFYDEHGAASDWSSENRFETSINMADQDGDGVLDDQKVDESQDLNGDGILDVMQPDTIKFISANNTNGIVAIGIDENQDTKIISGMSSGEPQNYVRMLSEPVMVPFGLFEYRLEVTEPGGDIKVKVFLPSPAENGAKWYQLGIEGDWTDYGEHALFSSDRKSVTLELKDGGYGDIDGIENGVIVDRSGLILTSQSSEGSTLPSSMDWGGSGACFVNTTARTKEVETFYIWLAVVGIAMLVLGKIAAIWHDKYPKIKKAR